MNDNVVENIRPLTGMERRYVNAYVVRRTWLQRIMGGVALVCLSSFLVCAIIFIFDVDRMVELAWVFFPTQFLCFFGVRYFSKKYKVRGYA
ncbi:hypothetical protein ACUN9Y_03930 [Halomonas sp. V046]|uniref:hypothetical protein n=1 Tax=Halomonas sp. V046 TaxID=3459611 RepID=UPI004043A781